MKSAIRDRRAGCLNRLGIASVFLTVVFLG
jgi:hypothetical protein